METPLGLIQANMFMGSGKRCCWKMRANTCTTAGMSMNYSPIKGKSSQFYFHPNQMYLALQLTSQGEDTNQLSYLDVLVMRKSSSLLTTAKFP